jgi:purine-binding chemotaxis protein CheW
MTDLPADTGRALTPPRGGRVLLFGVGGRMYGWAIDVVREIIPFRPATRLPGAPSFVCGLINLRGTIITVLDLGERLGVGAVNRAEGSIILVEHGAKLVGVAVDEMRDVRVVLPEQVEAPSGDAAQSGVVRGIAHTEGDVVILLDVQAIVRQVLS